MANSTQIEQLKQEITDLENGTKVVESLEPMFKFRDMVAQDLASATVQAQSLAKQSSQETTKLDVMYQNYLAGGHLQQQFSQQYPSFDFTQATTDKAGRAAQCEAVAQQMSQELSQRTSELENTLLATLRSPRYSC